jgi:hypothetical protein
MRGGDPNDFFSIYNVTTPIDKEIKIWDGSWKKMTIKKMNPVGMLFYNHKNGHFRLFAESNEQKQELKLIYGLCGIDIIGIEVRGFYDGGWDYYYIFDGKKLYTVTQEHSEFSSTELKWHKREIGQSQLQSDTILANKDEQIVSIGGTDFTFVKIVPDKEAKASYQGSTSMFSSMFSSTQNTVKSDFDQMRKVTKKILSEQRLAYEERRKKEREAREIKEKEEKEEKAAAAAAAVAKAEAALKAAQDAPKCKELELKFDSLKKALVEIDKIKKFWETQEDNTKSNAEICAEEWKKTEKAERIAEIDALIGGLYDITEMIKTNKDLCWAYFETIRLNGTLFPDVFDELENITKNKNDKTSLGVFQRLAKELAESKIEANKSAYTSWR